MELEPLSILLPQHIENPGLHGYYRYINLERSVSALHLHHKDIHEYDTSYLIKFVYYISTCTLHRGSFLRNPVEVNEFGGRCEFREHQYKNWS